jgi:hypothetical protein
MRARLKTWTVHRLCDLHTRLSLWQFDVEDWLERLDPTVPIPPKGCRTTAKMYWYDGHQVHSQVLKGRLIYGHELPFRERKAGR